MPKVNKIKVFFVFTNCKLVCDLIIPYIPKQLQKTSNMTLLKLWNFRKGCVGIKGLINLTVPYVSCNVFYGIIRYYSIDVLV